jgi:hypothetical protein
MSKVVATLPEQGDEWFRILEVVLTDLQAFDDDAVLQPVTKLVEIIVIKSILVEVELLDDFVLMIVVLEAGQDEVEALFGEQATQLELGWFLLAHASE